MMRSLGGLLIAIAITASTGAALWTCRIETIARPDGTTFRHNRFTGQMQLCDARRCIDATARQTPANDKTEDRLFEQLLEQTSATLLQELTEKSALQRANKTGLEKTIDLAFSAAAGALKPVFEAEYLMIGEPPFEKKSKFRVSVEHGLKELERQSPWNAFAGTVGSTLSGALAITIVSLVAARFLIWLGLIPSTLLALIHRIKLSR